MSDLELNHAQQEVRRSQEKLEQALEHLGSEIEQGMEHLSSFANQAANQAKDISGKLKDPTKMLEDFVDVPALVEKVKGTADRLFSDLRVSAEEELQKFESQPLMTWGVVLLSGFVLGFALARRNQESVVRSVEDQIDDRAA